MTTAHGTETTIRATARVMAVQEGLVTIESLDRGGDPVPLMKNEMVFIQPHASDERIQGEILRVRGQTAEAQVYEETRGVAVGDLVEQTGTQLCVTLGPGLLGQVYDGLQNPLAVLAEAHGFFLPRGTIAPPLDLEAGWDFIPLVDVDASLAAGDVIGTVREGRFAHKIMAPFDLEEPVSVTAIEPGTFSITDTVARVRDRRGRETALTMAQPWAVRKPIPEELLKQRLAERLYPSQPMVTTQRLIDTFFPIARGGTACIPGPFGAGKTVLQHLISKYSTVDIVIVVACGERAGEVVETITEFPALDDPRTGGSLMDRTIVICNTSSMPVAAREASMYTGITLGEYYRQMGYDVLLLADSTSRWAQAMRETSGRMEEIPGEEAFPAYLDSSIRAVYERAGVIRAPNGDSGSLTMIGTVSPAGGNFEEPVTQSTLGTVKTFLGLSAERAYRRFYPAVDPLLSWSRYREQLEEWFDRELGVGWTARVLEVAELLKHGDGVEQMMQVTGEEGITTEDFLTHQAAILVDMVYLQQDAFEPVDATTPLDRQKASFDLLYDLVTRSYAFDEKEAVREYFTRLTGLFKNLNYTPTANPAYEQYRRQIVALADPVTSPAGRLDPISPEATTA